MNLVTGPHRAPISAAMFTKWGFCALVFFLQPAFYCNVSDAWLFPKKSQRLWVGFLPDPIFELFLSGPLARF